MGTGRPDEGRDRWADSIEDHAAAIAFEEEQRRLDDLDWAEAQAAWDDE